VTSDLVRDNDGHPEDLHPAQPVYCSDAAAYVALRMPYRMVRVAVRALPVWVRICVGGAAKRITLSLSAGFGVAALLFLDLSAKQA